MGKLQHTAHDRPLVPLRCGRHVHHEAQVRVSQDPLQARKRCVNAVDAMSDHARKRLEARVVALGIQDANRVALKDELLAEKPGDPGLAGLGISSDHDVTAAQRQVDVLSVVAHPEPNPAATAARKRDSARREKLADVTGDRAGAVPGDHLVRNAPQGVAAPGDRSAQLADLEERMVVLSVADRKSVMG